MLRTDDDERFWMVWASDGGVPTHRHTSYQSAINEAERLARKCPGRQFYVLEATDMRCVDGMQRVRLHDGVPF